MTRTLVVTIGLLGLSSLGAGCLNDRHLGERTGEWTQRIFQEQARGRRSMLHEGVPAEEAEVAVANMRAVWQRAQSGAPSTPLLPVATGR
jgi:hypothetical protein